VNYNNKTGKKQAKEGLSAAAGFSLSKNLLFIKKSGRRGEAPDRD
jgi:hypothetical protein